jgi:hypothetical protein
LSSKSPLLLIGRSKGTSGIVENDLLIRGKTSKRGAEVQRERRESAVWNQDN